MLNFNESDCCSGRSSLPSLSTVGSLELVDSISSPQFNSFAPLKPKNNKESFSEPEEAKSISYASLYPRVLDIIQELQQALTPVNIRDDCSLQSKVVFLRIPLKRKYQ